MYCFVVEQNRDAQLRSLLMLETRVPKDKLRSVLIYGGFPLSARHVLDDIRNQLEDLDMPSIVKPVVSASQSAAQCARADHSRL